MVATAMLFLCYKTKKKIWYAWILIVIYAFSIRPVSDLIIKPLENRYEQPSLTILHDAKAIIALGGGSYGGVKDYDGKGQITGDTANRLFMVLRLHQALRLPIVFSGGLVFTHSANEADAGYRLLKACGVDDKYLIKESQSRNTVENARFTRQICEQKGFDMVILVTSAYHMPRSVLLFEREGMNVIPYPTDYKTDNNTVPDAFAFIPEIHNLRNTAIALKEYLGIAAIKAGLQ